MSTSIPAAVRREVAERYGLAPGETKTLKCHYCDETTEAYWPLGHRGKPTYWPMFGRGFALDHVLPRARGGKHEASNLVLACTPCNSRKRDRLIPVAAPQLLPESPATENGATPQGKGREGKRKGMEGNATAIWSLVDGGQVALHLKSLTGRQDAMHGEKSWL